MNDRDKASESGEPPRGDPRLEIPEVLRRPVPRPEYDPAGEMETKSEKPSDIAAAGKAWAVALDFVFTIIAGALLGWAVDYWRHSLPLWTMIGLGAGFVTAFVRIVRRTMREEKANRNRSGDGNSKGSSGRR